LKLWQLLQRKLYGVVCMLQVLHLLKRNLFLVGTTKRLASLDKKITKKPHWFILMPNTTTKKIWSAISHILLIFTALYVPIEVAFASTQEKSTQMYVIT
jgi:hypothetical protein